MRLFPILLVLFLLVPLLEIYLLIKVGSHIGAFNTIVLVVATAIGGAALLRLQGLATLTRVRQEMEAGVLPAMPMLEGVLLVFAGALLLTPGFFTDALGFLLLIPPLRRALIREFIRAGAGRMGPPGPPPGGAGQPGGGDTERGPRTLEGEYWRDED
ncbi:MAG TPA: FxsA family protein [Gammaproteobacteria bacterium]|nr:FxsA family protein [Gammaproteobacteria bacterium]